MQKFKDKGAAFVLGDLTSWIGRVDHDGHAIGRYGGEVVNENGKRVIAFLGGNDLTAMTGRSRYETPEYTRQRVVHNEFPV